MKFLYIYRASSSFAPTIVAAPLVRKLTDNLLEILLSIVTPRLPLVLTWYPSNSAFSIIFIKSIGEDSSDGVTVYVLLPISLPHSSSISSCCCTTFTVSTFFFHPQEGHSSCLNI